MGKARHDILGSRNVCFDVIDTQALIITLFTEGTESTTSDSVDPGPSPLGKGQRMKNTSQYDNRTIH